MEIGQKVYVVDYDYKKEQRIEEYEIKKIGRKYIHVWKDKHERTVQEYEIESYNSYAHRCKYSSPNNLYITMQAIQDEKDRIGLYRKIKNELGEYMPAISLDKLRKINEILEEK